MFGIERIGIDGHHNGAVLAAVWQRDSGTLHGGELRSYEVLAVIVKLLFGERLNLQAQLKDQHFEASKDRISGGKMPGGGGLMMAATPSTCIRIAMTTNVSVVTALTAVTHQTSHPGDSPSDHFVDLIFQNRFDDLPVLSRLCRGPLPQPRQPRYPGERALGAECFQH